MPSGSSHETPFPDFPDVPAFPDPAHGAESDPLTLARLLLAGDDRTVRAPRPSAGEAGHGSLPLLTGAEAVAALLADAGVRNVFVYAGTSELAICDALDRTEGVRLSHGRGDKESAFMAAGASLVTPGRGAAVLHGARGLTNAAGAVADARRNEAGALFLVGLPSSGSVRFLPPHGEDGLLDGIGTFADWSWQAPPVPADPGERRDAAERFVERLRASLAFCAAPPSRPAIFGVPQDVAESRWIPLDALLTTPPSPPATDLRRPALEALLGELRQARRPLFLLDDHALHYPGVRPALDRLSGMTGAAVLQVRYWRGPMLFERLRAEEVTNFAGWLNPFSAAHRALLAECDLLVTVEDRNLYERVVGPLPDCRKAAVSTDPSKVLKNEYLRDDEPLVVGEPATVLMELADRLDTSDRPAPWFPARALAEHMVSPERARAAVEDGRRAVARTLASWDRPALVDDSQMFGGLPSEHYDEFPAGLRVPQQVVVPVGEGLTAVRAAVTQLEAVPEKSAAEQGPTLVEIVLPPDPEVWKGIWITQGFEEAPAEEPESVACPRGRRSVPVSRGGRGSPSTWCSSSTGPCSATGCCASPPSRTTSTRTRARSGWHCSASPWVPCCPSRSPVSSSPGTAAAPSPCSASR